MQSRVGLRIIFLCALLRTEQEISSRGRSTARKTINHLLIILGRFGCGQKSRGIGRAPRVIELETGIATCAEKKDRDDGEVGVLVLIAAQLRHESSVVCDLGW